MVSPFFFLFLFCLFTTSLSLPNDVDDGRKIFAWVDPKQMNEALTQLNNETWSYLFDGIIVQCGFRVVDVSPYTSLNLTEFESCLPLLSAVSNINLSNLNKNVSANFTFEFWVGAIPQSIITADDDTQSNFLSLLSSALISLRSLVSSSSPFSSSSSAAAFLPLPLPASSLPLGLSFDDELDCAPRSTLANITLWTTMLTKITRTLSEIGRSDNNNNENRNNNSNDSDDDGGPWIVSVDVQALFGIQDEEYKPGQACEKYPWEYKFLPEVPQMFVDSGARMYVMDTYYFTTSRFSDALSYYARYYSSPPSSSFSSSSFSFSSSPSLVFGVCNRPLSDLTDEDRASRLYALDHTASSNNNSIDNLVIFTLPVQEEWLTWLERFKTRCRYCPGILELSCYQPSVSCRPT